MHVSWAKSCILFYTKFSLYWVLVCRWGAGQKGGARGHGFCHWTLSCHAEVLQEDSSWPAMLWDEELSFETHPELNSC